MASATQVFAVPELLEMILLCLPERDLLLSQRVDTKWRNVTKTSPHLQRKLFYNAEVCDPGSPTDWVWNPLLKFALLTGSGLSSSKPKTKSTKTSWNDMFMTQPATSEVHVELPLYYFENGYHKDGEQPLGSEVHSLRVQEQAMGTVKNPNGVTIEDVWSTVWIEQAVVNLSRVEYNAILVVFAVCDVSGERQSRHPLTYRIDSISLENDTRATIVHQAYRWNSSDYAGLHGASLWI